MADSADQLLCGHLFVYFVEMKYFELIIKKSVLFRMS